MLDLAGPSFIVTCTLSGAVDCKIHHHPPRGSRQATHGGRSRRAGSAGPTAVSAVLAEAGGGPWQLAPLLRSQPEQGAGRLAAGWGVVDGGGVPPCRRAGPTRRTARRPARRTGFGPGPATPGCRSASSARVTQAAARAPVVAMVAIGETGLTTADEARCCYGMAKCSGDGAGPDAGRCRCGGTSFSMRSGSSFLASPRRTGWWREGPNRAAR